MSTSEPGSNLSLSVSHELGKQIINGFFGPHRGLPTEAELGAQFGVSRSVVREAIKMLAAKGLLTSKPRQGISILPQDQWNIFDPDLLNWSLESNPSLALLREFLQVRKAIEPEAAALAAEFASEEKILAIGDALEAMTLASDRDLNTQLDADIAFHTAILYATENRFYIRLRDFTQTALRVSIRHTSSLKNDYPATLIEHHKVYGAIASRQPEEAKQAMYMLVEDALRLIDQQLKQPGAPSPAAEEMTLTQD
jgi:DNA-binding FadR family transcriptional regulator